MYKENYVGCLPLATAQFKLQLYYFMASIFRLTDKEKHQGRLMKRVGNTQKWKSQEQYMWTIA